MSDANANAWCARLIAESLNDFDTAAVVTCPGNRNAPLLFALKQVFAERCYSHIDERSAAFMALAMARASGRPAVVCMTSGTAVANCLPALCEAHASHVPLIVLSADRPDALHDSGAPQCMRQQHIFKPFVADSLHLSLSTIDSTSMELALMQIQSAMLLCTETPGAPVHINICFDDPLPPVTDDEWQQPAEPQLKALEPTPQLHSSALPEQLRNAVNGAQHGLIVCGPDAPLSIEQVNALSQTSGFPVIADACSGKRHPAVTHVISNADLLVQGPLGQTSCDVLIRVGAAPLNRPLYEYCARQDCPIVRIDREEIRKDFLHRQFFSLVAPDDNCLHALGNLCQGDTGWLQNWQTADAAVASKLNNFLETADWGECSAAAAICRNQDFPTVQLANSMAVRHGNLFCEASEQQIIAWRGVNGIDGSIATFIGWNLYQQQPALFLCGDIAFLHDLAALHAANMIQHPACICVLNNNGGHIFDLLPAAECAGYESLMQTPQHCDIAAIASAFHLEYSCCANMQDLNAALHKHAGHPALSIIEVQVDGSSLKREWPALKALAT